MTELEARSLFTLAGIEVQRIWELPNGYGSDRCQLDYMKRNEPSRPITDFYLGAPWWLVKTPFGLVMIGWRKRVINIDWSDTAIRAVVTADDVTKSDVNVHAWSIEKALEYLKALAVAATSPSLADA